MIQVNHLTKSYTQPNGEVLQVLKDVNCHISKGEVISIIGPSGTGKSTFLRALNLLDEPTSGEIIVGGENILQKKYPLRTSPLHPSSCWDSPRKMRRKKPCRCSAR